MIYVFYDLGWEFLLISYFLNYEFKKIAALLFELTPANFFKKVIKTVVYS